MVKSTNFSENKLCGLARVRTDNKDWWSSVSRCWPYGISKDSWYCRGVRCKMEVALDLVTARRRGGLATAKSRFSFLGGN